MSDPSRRRTQQFASSTSGFSADLFPRASVTTRVSELLPRAAVTARVSGSVRFSLDRSVSAGRSLSGAASRSAVRPGAKRTCMCSPTSHPGSFRCGFHKGLAASGGGASGHAPANRLGARRSAMTNSLVRIGGVEGDLVRRALAALIRPSSHHQRRRHGFQPRRSRLSAMSTAEEGI